METRFSISLGVVFYKFSYSFSTQSWDHFEDLHIATLIVKFSVRADITDFIWQTGVTRISVKHNFKEHWKSTYIFVGIIYFFKANFTIYFKKRQGILQNNAPFSLHFYSESYPVRIC